ncbi:unnamed protein product, partial [Brassica rapa]
QPTWAKITQTVHGMGQRAESKDQRADMYVLCVLTDTHGCHDVLICVLMNSHRRHVCADGHTRTHMDVLCVLTDIHGRHVCADRKPRTATDVLAHTDVLCVLTDTHGRPVCTEQTGHVGKNHPNCPREGSACGVQGHPCCYVY